ncbi:MAG: helix-hairpin-helix domain-containing protein [Kofleriaceae bacterium]
MSVSISKPASRAAIAALAIVALVFAMGGTWSTRPANAAPGAVAPAVAKPGVTTTTAAITDHADEPRGKPAKKDLNGKLNLNTASEEQLMMLPSVGPSKAERIVVWRKKNGGFKRVADLRRVKGFGYRTFKRLEPLLDIKGDTTLAAKK